MLIAILAVLFSSTPVSAAYSCTCSYREFTSFGCKRQVVVVSASSQTELNTSCVHDPGCERGSRYGTLADCTASIPLIETGTGDYSYCALSLADARRHCEDPKAAYDESRLFHWCCP